MSLSREKQLFNAAFDGDLAKVRLLCNGPALNINWQNKEGYTPLFVACQEGQAKVVRQLLSLRGIDPLRPQHDGATPLFIACQKGHKEVALLLLADLRIDLNKPTNDAATPLYVASQNGHLGIVQHLLASGREIDTKRRSAVSKRTAAEQGRAVGAKTTKDDKDKKEDFQRKKTNGPLCADLIDAYEKDPAKVRSQLREQLGLPGNPPLPHFFLPLFPFSFISYFFPMKLSPLLRSHLPWLPPHPCLVSVSLPLSPLFPPPSP